MISILKIQGESMSPLYMEGDYLIVARPFRRSSIIPGKNIIFQHDKYGLIVKTITSVDIVRQIFHSKGLNKNSITDQEIGETPFRNIKGLPLFHIRKKIR
jgi:phage repressor protein C with HTH and peptisase S24 domain